MSRHKRVQSKPTSPDLPITPMLDMSFQLMAFFILTFKPSPTEAQLAMMLPSPGSSCGPVTEPPNELPPLYKISVTPTGGVPSDITVTEEGNPATTSFKATPQDSRKAMSDLLRFMVDDVRKRKAAADNGLPKVEFQFDDAVQYVYVMKLLDGSKQAGYEQVSTGGIGRKFIPPPK